MLSGRTQAYYLAPFFSFSQTYVVIKTEFIVHTVPRYRITTLRLVTGTLIIVSLFAIVRSCFGDDPDQQQLGQASITGSHRPELCLHFIF